MTKSQWQCFLENLGIWQGSFIRISPHGEVIRDIPSIVSFTELEDKRTIRQVVQREGEQDLVLEYSSLPRSTLFFDNGAFSQGSLQFAPFSEFGAELGLIYGNRRLRLVQFFNPQQELSHYTLIPEYLAGTSLEPNPPLKIEDLLGEWQGEAITIYTDWRSPDNYSTQLNLTLDNLGRLQQSLSYGDRTITTSASICGSILQFDQNPQNPIQVILLPHGASATSPVKISLRQPFFLEVGWLIEINLRQRMIRTYNEKGEWVSLTLVTEKKVSSSNG
ncbi:DUF3598 family protein [Calothrix sp. 336/3]|uniref:DUF3598 family protein n=1 Tax=Calothrix sp. 336/3 TaxID=1337936 RepID=UPI0004E3AE75|nr:DUF3598 family protein [Calothrix sp. 336/3]AKG22622.1 hypothetical protein IJ00_16290 [Calothrix sp. 336/3]